MQNPINLIFDTSLTSVVNLELKDQIKRLQPAVKLLYSSNFKPKYLYKRSCNSCIMGPSNFPDMYTQAKPEDMGLHIKQIMRARDTTDMCHARSLLVINHPFQYETDH